MRGPDCGTFPGLASSEVYPSESSSPEDVVSALDEKITRSSPDFKRLHTCSCGIQDNVSVTKESIFLYLMHIAMSEYVMNDVHCML